MIRNALAYSRKKETISRNYLSSCVIVKWPSLCSNSDSAALDVRGTLADAHAIFRTSPVTGLFFSLKNDPS